MNMYLLKKNGLVLLLVLIILALIFYLTFTKLNKADNSFSGAIDKYEAGNRFRDSLLREIRGEIAKIKTDRDSLFNAISKYEAKAEDNKKVLDYFNLSIYEIRKDIKNNRPNYSDSSASAINDLLPK